MKTADEIEFELSRVRQLLRLHRASGDEDNGMLYGAQQALGWIIEGLQSPSMLENTIAEVAQLLEQESDLKVLDDG
jgi:hypothetical protein